MAATTTYQTPAQVAVPAATVRGWLRLEGAAAFIAGLALYGWLGGPWLIVLPLLLLPDLSAIGYLRGPRLGAFTYNVVHNWALGLAVLGRGLRDRQRAARDRRSRPCRPRRDGSRSRLRPEALRRPSTTPTSAGWAARSRRTRTASRLARVAQRKAEQSTGASAPEGA